VTPGPMDSGNEVAKEVAKVRVVVRSIIVPYEPQAETRAALTELLYTAAASIGSPQPGVVLLSESYAGKSTGLKQFAIKVNGSGEWPSNEMPVVVATLDPEGTPASVATDILRGLNEPRPDRGSTEGRWERVRSKLATRRVKVLALDEFQRAGRRTSVSGVIAGKIQDIMDQGLCSCAFFGKTSAREIFKNCPDLVNRLDVPVQMPPLKWLRTEDAKLFTDFVEDFDQALQTAGVTTARSGFKEGDLPQLLLEASNGLIGIFCRIVETAVMAARRDGRTVIDRADLSQAVVDWGIGNGRVTRNPFEKPR